VSGRPAQTGRREQTKQANRAAILVAGRAVFAELGYGAASVRDIVRRTDLASGTFYNYFPDKESVLRALVEETAEEARTRVRSARRNAVAPEEFVRERAGAGPPRRDRRWGDRPA
jgi:AcrR family transcriptional regulator